MRVTHGKIQGKRMSIHKILCSHFLKRTNAQLIEEIYKLNKSITNNRRNFMNNLKLFQNKW